MRTYLSRHDRRASDVILCSDEHSDSHLDIASITQSSAASFTKLSISDGSEPVDIYVASGTREILSVDRPATRVPPSSTLLLESFDDASHIGQGHSDTMSKDETPAEPLHPGINSSWEPSKSTDVMLAGPFHPGIKSSIDSSTRSKKRNSIKDPKIPLKSWTHFPKNLKFWSCYSRKQSLSRIQRFI